MINKKTKKVMVFGTFDILHPGHLNFFKQANKYGDSLIVVVARDKTVKEVKNRKPLNDEKSRLKKIKETGLAKEVILGGLGDKYKVIKNFKPDVVCLGYDQKVFIEELKNKLKSFNLKTKIARLKPFKPKIYKSSIIKNYKIKN